jgi:tRNA (cytidine/uridine-2'-O-)-methyltransferase
MEPNADLNFFSTKGKKLIWEKKFSPPTYLVFGCESSGLPKKFYETYKDLLLRIPISSRIRSLNLATSVGIAVFEVARQLGMGE